MESFEAKLDQATAFNEILGATVAVINKDGIIYRNTIGHQTLAHNSPLVNDESTFALGSAGVFITHIAALQCVENGYIRMDEPVSRYLPELQHIIVVKRKYDAVTKTNTYETSCPESEITLRHFLTNTSGLYEVESDCLPYLHARESARLKHNRSMRQAPVVIGWPLKCQPGNGWVYGMNTGWIQILIERVTKQRLPDLIQELIFDQLDMRSSSYMSCNEKPKVATRLVQTVQRTEFGLEAAKEEDTINMGLMTSIDDLASLFSDLVSPEPTILKPASIEAFFSPQLSEKARSDFRRKVGFYAPYAAKLKYMEEAPVTYSFGGLIAEEELPLSKMPPGTVTWNGCNNLIWAVNKEKRLAMVWATQLFPDNDQKCVELAMEFFRCAWKQFG